MRELSLVSDQPSLDQPPDDLWQTVADLIKVLSRGLRALGNAGHPDAASRLAAQAWLVVRDRDSVAAERLSGLLHYLARLDPEPGTPGALASAVHPLEESTVAVQQLDVRSEAPARRHELIFGACANLPLGGAFVLVNDHDPKPLHYQLLAEHPGEFDWEYVEAGPEVWRVRIGRAAAAAG